MNLNTIFFIGPQGSGKGTQAKILSKKLGFFYWEMGGILREVAAGESELGKKIKKLIDQGILLSDEQLYEVVDDRLSQIPKDQGVIFDGIPRRIPQAEHLMDFLQKQGRVDFATLFINLAEEQIMQRLVERGKRENRADDTPEKIRFRLEQYKKDTVPVLAYLKERSTFIEIDSRPPVEEVAQTIANRLSIP
jgi:adenylate kinase